MKICSQAPPLLLLALVAALLGGCSTFQRDWEAHADLAASAEDASAEVAMPVGLEGRWTGTWTSARNGHHGGLRCIITTHPLDTEDGEAASDATDPADTFLARYHATYAGFLSFEYELVMHVRRDGETCHFSAEANLGWLAGGRYQYEGTVVGDEFRSTYTSKGDFGTFEMRRLTD